MKIIAALGTIVTGSISMIKPSSVRGFTGLEAPGSRGITEIRAVLGGFFIALGASPLIFASQPMYMMLRIAYLGVAAVCLVSIFIDKSFIRSNYNSLAVEILLGVILVI